MVVVDTEQERPEAISPAADAALDRLDAARQRWWLFTLLSTTVLAACVSFGLLLAMTAADAVARFSQNVLLGMSMAWLAVTAMLIALVARRLLRGQRSLEATARRVESAFPGTASSLINIVQLSEDRQSEGRVFRTAAVNKAAAEIKHVRFADAARGLPRRRRFIHHMQIPRDLLESLFLLLLLIAVSLCCRQWVPNWDCATARLLTPWRFVPSVGSVGEIKVTPGDVDVLIGASLEIAAKINNPDGAPHKALLFVAPAGEKEAARAMAADGRHGRYTLTLSSITESLRYRVEIGDSQSGAYNVAVRQKPTMAEVEVTLHFPAYLDRADETFVQKHGDLEAPQYTVARLQVHPSVPIAKGHVNSGADRYTGRVERGGELLVVEKLPLLNDSTYTVHLFNGAGHTDPDPRVNRVDVIPDLAPTVQLVKPPRRSSAALGGEVPVTIRAGDDHGLGKLRLETKIQAPGREEPSEHTREPPATIARQWTDLEGDTAAVRHHLLKLDPQDVRPGQTVLVRAVASDRRVLREWGLDLKPRETAGGWHSIQVIAPEEEAAARLEEIDELRAALWEMLQRQIRARVTAATILRQQQLPERTRAAAGVRAGQVDVQRAAIELVKSIGSSEQEERSTIRRVLNSLALGDMLQAVRLCDALLKLTDPDAFNRPTTELVAAQDRIIDMLRRLLDVARQAQSDVLGEMASRPAGDLPDDVRARLDELRDKLDEFLEQQQKVIEATENLAKTPVEDFSEMQEQLLAELAAVEDDWSRFLEEFHSDLSKLPEQDFANTSLLKELVEIYTEVEMAEGALLGKTCDMAVPLEQLGAEMAEELVANLERWLPETPDRERWSQEESLSDFGKEAPMAELPGELEDLVGELMEEEEDLFDEMEDVSSSAADSTDKDAGWDTTDGPISNMSAKGTTGNRLPNTSEIGGRSGEGRSGKSSGEFVGEEATGKGGRKTPSRLTPDPYTDGQIKDHGQDPAGGASGGGKESGQGGEGLEGPAPPSPGERQLRRLAGRQAALRNRAEGIDLQFQVTNFHHTDLEKMIELMAQVERDLRAGRYQNALRQRQVILDGLGNVKQYLDGEFEVRRDATSNLPTDVQKELLGSMRDPSPAGWEQLNRQYFERLNTGGEEKGEERREKGEGRSVRGEE